MAHAESIKETPWRLHDTHDNHNNRNGSYDRKIGGSGLATMNGGMEANGTGNVSIVSIDTITDQNRPLPTNPHQSDFMNAGRSGSHHSRMHTILFPEHQQTRVDSSTQDHIHTANQQRNNISPPNLASAPSSSSVSTIGTANRTLPTITAQGQYGSGTDNNIFADVQPHNGLLASVPRNSNISSGVTGLFASVATTQLQNQLPLTNGGAPGSGTSRHTTTMGYSGLGRGNWSTLGNPSPKSDRSAEGKSIDGDESAEHSSDMGIRVNSPLATGLTVPPVEHSVAHDSTTGSNAGLGTPSTVSTAPSTEDASVGAESVDKIGMKIDSNAGEPFTLHRRMPSWEDGTVFGGNIPSSAPPAMHHQLPQHDPGNQPYWMQSHPSQAFKPAQPQAQWNGGRVPQPRVASFRADGMIDHKNDAQPRFYTQAPHAGLVPGSRHYGDSQSPYLSQQGRVHEVGGQGFRVNAFPLPRKPGYPQHSIHQNPSPPRVARPARVAGQSPHRQHTNIGSTQPGSAPAGANPSRSSSEILKTLLRKKACLYEPDTSRAVALVTWLVGRILALEYGFFSRQQLQAGVHACVAEKIDSGTITRTKVNRCMQIILNSCFHYIIPRPDGTEEKGSAFREVFSKEVSDDTELLRLLPTPWNVLTVDKDVVLRASAAEATEFKEPQSRHGSPKGSPKLSPVEKSSPNRDSTDGDAGDMKRAVLLCFNENVRAAEDVFRCHNEFIRDSAHSSNLQLNAQEWRVFFGKDAASTPLIWGNVGIPVVSCEPATDGASRKPDVLGQMTQHEADKFRTTWCAKRYDHDHEFCGMAHVEINGGWLRRNPSVHWYKDEMCPHITKVFDKSLSPNSFILNECPKGVHCEYAHSSEEMIYHPNRYKSQVCSSIIKSGTCRFGDICPHHHPADSVRPPKKTGEGRPPSARHRGAMVQTHSGASKNGFTMPLSSPILYASPAPVSSFEKHLLMPGLQSLFRRHCSVVRSHLRASGKCKCCYSYFGDDIGVDDENQNRPPSSSGFALPQHRT